MPDAACINGESMQDVLCMVDSGMRDDDEER
jgi:hypothetical protein